MPYNFLYKGFHVHLVHIKTALKTRISFIFSSLETLKLKKTHYKLEEKTSPTVERALITSLLIFKFTRSSDFLLENYPIFTVLTKDIYACTLFTFQEEGVG